MAAAEAEAPRTRSGLRRGPFAGPPVALAAGETASHATGEAMRRRASAHGDLGGPVAATDLGDCCGRPTRAAPLPAPAAGCAAPTRAPEREYAARLRLVVREVAGLRPGLYELDPRTRALLPVAAAPTTAELASASMWFGPADGSAEGAIDVSTLPALIGLYVELGALRSRYGLRALRFAYLEAGHLAQNLALTAAATGLSLGMVGAFYDDIAHELFMLDGIDDVLAYLLPVGCPVPR